MAAALLMVAVSEALDGNDALPQLAADSQVVPSPPPVQVYAAANAPVPARAKARIKTAAEHLRRRKAESGGLPFPAGSLLGAEALERSDAAAENPKALIFEGRGKLTIGHSEWNRLAAFRGL